MTIRMISFIVEIAIMFILLLLLLLLLLITIKQSPDMIIKRNNNLWILELSVGFETNLEKNRNAKNLRYNTLIQRLKKRIGKLNLLILAWVRVASTPSLRTPSRVCCPT